MMAGVDDCQIERLVVVFVAGKVEADLFIGAHAVAGEQLHLQRDHHVDLALLHAVHHLELDQVFLVADGRPVESPLDAGEIGIAPHPRVVGEDLPLRTLYGDLGGLDSCAVDHVVEESDSVPQTHHLL